MKKFGIIIANTQKGETAVIDEFDWKEPRCPFDFDFYKEKPSDKPTGHINVGEMISQIDRLYARGDAESAARVMEEYAEKAKKYGDINGELSAVNELLGNYRMNGKKEKGLAAAERCFELLKAAQIGGSVSAGTILINLATALCAFGENEKALRCYTDACRCYGANMPADDLRFAPLYNNMASVYEKNGDFGSAETYYKRAAEILSAHPGKSENLLDLAVSFINLAQLYQTLDPADERIAEYAEKAMEIFGREEIPHNYYYAHTAGKCAGAFGYLGYFAFENELKELEKLIYSGK